MVKGRFTDNENREIMKTIFKQNKNALEHHYTLTDPVWTELGDQLNRRPEIIFQHWERFNKQHLLQYENQTEIEDIRPVLIGYFVEKGIKFRSEINWRDISKDKRFKGINPFFLTNKLNEMVSHVKRANPGIERDNITIEDVRQFLDEKGKKPFIDKHVRRLIEDYVNFKNSM